MVFMARILIPDFLLLRDTQIYKKPSCAQLSRSLSLAICLLFLDCFVFQSTDTVYHQPLALKREFYYEPGTSLRDFSGPNIRQLPAGWKPLQQLDIRSSTSNLRLSSAIFDFNSCFGRKSWSSVCLSFFFLSFFLLKRIPVLSSDLQASVSKSVITWAKISAGLNFETRRPKTVPRQRPKRL